MLPFKCARRQPLQFVGHLPSRTHQKAAAEGKDFNLRGGLFCHENQPGFFNIVGRFLPLATGCLLHTPAQ